MNRVGVCVVLALSLGAGGAAQAQLTSADIPVELAETGTFGMGARAAGMGFAYTAVAEDATAVFYNPAALAQVRQVELSFGLAHDTVDRTLSRSGIGETHDTATRFEHLALAYPVPTYRGSVVWAIAYHRFADLDQDTFMTGTIEPPAGGNPGVKEVEDVLQHGTINAWTGAVAWDVSREISIGISLSYLTGDREENLVTANGIPDPTAGGCPGGFTDEYGLYYGCGDPSERSLFKTTIDRGADVDGWTGSVAVMGHPGGGFRLAGVVDLPRWLEYQGGEYYRQEDYWGIYEENYGFSDDIMLPLSLRGGASWGRSGFLVSTDIAWTDWTQIDFEGDIRAPDRSQAYRATVAVGVGAEYQIANTPLRVRGGFRYDPLPYKLIAADSELFYYDGADGFPGPDGDGEIDDYSVTQRNYPEADITGDRTWFSLGAGVLIPAGLTLDVAWVHGSWERESGPGYTPLHGFPTVEEFNQDRLFLTAAFHFQ